MSVFHNNALIGAGGGAVAAAGAVATKSLRFNSGDSAYLNRTPSSSGNRKTFTFSAWVKRTVLVAGNSPNKEIFIVVGTSNTTHFQLGFRADSLYVANLNTFLRVTDAVFRDTSAWYHIVLAVDTTQSTADDRIKLYVNGSQITSFSSSSNPSQDSDTGVNHTLQHNIGKEDNYFDGYMADIYLIDGSALNPTSFGAFDDNGVWQAAAYSGTYGTNGFHLLDFANESTIGHDSSGNNNDFTANNLQSSDGPIYSSGASFSPSQLSSSRGGDKAFDGLTSTNASASTANGSNVTITFSPSLTSVTSLEVFSDSNSSFAYINGASGTTVNISAGSYTDLSSLASGASGTISSLSVQTNGDNAKIAAIKVNGAILIDGDKGDVMFDVPTNDTENTDSGAGGELSGNYCTLNPLDSALTLSNGNLDFSKGAADDWKVARSTIFVSSGKWYWEAHVREYNSGTQPIILGIARPNGELEGTDTEITSGGTIEGYEKNGQKRVNGSLSSYGASYTNGDVISFALDLDAGTLLAHKNGSSQGVLLSSITTPVCPVVALYTGGTQMGTGSLSVNFGQRPFVYPIIQSRLVSGPIAGSPNDATAMFDGSTSTFTDHSSTNSTITYNNTLTGVTSLKVYIHQGNSTGTVTTVGANGTQTDTIAADFGPGYHTISLTSTGSTIRSIAFTRGGSGNFLSIYAIEVNGVVLTDSTATGFKTLNTANLPTPTIADGSDYFAAKIFTGNGSSTKLTTGFSPDFVWLKSRGSAFAHYLGDTVRGNTKLLRTTSTAAEITSSTGITSFDSDGVTLGSGSETNANNDSMVAWIWDGGSSTVSNTDGNVTTNVRANTTAGFSIVTYTGSGSSTASYGHGLGVEPHLIITKRRDAANDWYLYFKVLGNGKYLSINSTSAAGTLSNYWGTVNSTVFSQTYTTAGPNNGSQVAYCFAPVAGYSAIGEYDGNGSTDGPFIHTGFRVAFLIVKCHTATELWMLHDSTRDPDNVVSKLLQPHTTDAEIDSVTNYGVDFLSNGFKFRSSSNRNNGSGKSYIYIAFAENPFQANGGLAR